jgi:glycosyltransferase involved in cell wall biosynthesis
MDASDGNSALRILWVNCRLLHPLNGGDRIRTYNMLKELKKTHQITYLCLRSQEDTSVAISRAVEFCHRLVTVPLQGNNNKGITFYFQLMRNMIAGKYPFFAQKYFSIGFQRTYKALIAEGRFDVVVCDYLAPMVNFLDFETTIPLVVFQHNVESLIWKRHARFAKNPLKRAVFLRESSLTIRLEDAVSSVATGQIAVSPEECQYFSSERKMRNVLGHVPTGVDCAYYSPGKARDPYTMAFLGSMDWHANIDAVQYFVKDIFPLIKRRLPGARFLVIGRNPPASIQALSNGQSSIEVTGTVDDVRPSLSRASVMVLPLRVGGGTRIKVFEAMAAGLAVVSTKVGAEGLPVTEGKNILFGENAHEFASKVCELLDTPELLERVSTAGRRLVEEKYTWKAAACTFERLLRTVCK